MSPGASTAWLRSPRDLARRRLLLAALAGGGWAAHAPAQALQRSARRLFGSGAELLMGPRDDARQAEPVWRHLAEIDRRWNAWKPGELQMLNQAIRQGRWAPVSPRLRQVIVEAARLETASLGLFNPAIGGLVGSWGFHADILADGPGPDAATRAHWRRAAPSLRQLRFDGARLSSVNPWVQLDLGAYAKGAAIDGVLDELARQGVGAALLNLGGNLAGYGRPNGRPWRVGVQDPFGAGVRASLQLQGREAVVTSGTYERQRRLADGGLCSHVIDPGSAAPAMAFCSVTVVHSSAGLADAAATALLVAGPARWRLVAERMGVRLALVIDQAGRCQATDAMWPRLDLA